jgi:hypothetical protein
VPVAKRVGCTVMIYTNYEKKVNMKTQWSRPVVNQL